jgi:hypothetical protein
MGVHLRIVTTGCV